MPAEVKLRPAGDDDLEPAEVVRARAAAEVSALRGGRLLVAQAGADGSQPLAAWLEAADRYLVVAEDGARLVGYLAVHLDRAGQYEIGHVDEIFVVPEERRRGVGTSLVAEARQWALARGCTGLDGVALPGSRSMKSFFEAQRLTARLLVMHQPLQHGEE